MTSSFSQVLKELSNSLYVLFIFCFWSLESFWFCTGVWALGSWVFASWPAMGRVSRSHAVKLAEILRTIMGIHTPLQVLNSKSSVLLSSNRESHTFKDTYPPDALDGERCTNVASGIKGGVED